jgi:hypothetical protein
VFDVHDIYPLQETTLEGVRAWVPARVEDVLDAWYGHGYRTDDSLAWTAHGYTWNLVLNQPDIQPAWSKGAL